MLTLPNNEKVFKAQKNTAHKMDSVFLTKINESRTQR